jgi:hypothetical protein
MLSLVLPTKAVLWIEEGAIEFRRAQTKFDDRVQTLREAAGLWTRFEAAPVYVNCPIGQFRDARISFQHRLQSTGRK